MVRRVNMHSHLLLAETFNTFPPYGPKVVEEPDGTLGYQVGDYKIVFGDHVRDPRFTDGGARIADMNQRGTDVMGVTISPLNYLLGTPRNWGCLQPHAERRHEPLLLRGPQASFFLRDRSIARHPRRRFGAGARRSQTGCAGPKHWSDRHIDRQTCRR
jgi:hypothetical protein